MFRVAYVNGRYRPHGEAMVHIEDRGYQFSDGVYEVCEVRGGLLVDERRHMARLQRSLAELRIDMPMSLAALGVVLRETVRRNRVRDGLVYLQVTRGAARRDHGFPAPGTVPQVVVVSRPLDPVRAERVVDPTGCGDAYRAGLIYGLTRGLDWATTGRVASLMGAIKIAHHGTQSHRFTLADVGARFQQAFGYAL